MRAKYILVLAFSLSTLFVSAQSWLPQAESQSDGNAIPNIGEWANYKNEMYIKYFNNNYVGYVKAIRECEQLMTEAGKSFNNPDSDKSIVPTYLENEDLSSSTWETAVSLETAEVFKAWFHLEGYITTLQMNKDEYKIVIMAVEIPNE